MKSWDDLKWWMSPAHDRLHERLDVLQREGRVIYPREWLYLNALHLTPFHKVKCVILGQDPYHGEGQADGLAFSCLTGIPPSLKNIHKEYHNDLVLPLPRSGSLYSWSQMGVLLLNTVLSVERGKPGSHDKLGWSPLICEILSTLSRDREEKLAFIFWGKKAQEYRGRVHGERHLLIESSHPSPYSVNQGFRGHRPFSRVNQFLHEAGQELIDWRLA